MEERYQFYSTVMRHVASTLVLETQRTELIKRTTTAQDMADVMMMDLGEDFYSDCSSEVSDADAEQSDEERADDE
jgi:hypothetical protein